MDARMFRYVCRNINTFQLKVILRNYSTPYHQRLLCSVPNLLGLPSITTKNVNGLSKKFSLRSYNTSRVLRQEDGKKLERPAEMNRTRQSMQDQPQGGPVTWTNLWATGGVIAILMGAYYYAKAQKDAKRDADRKREMGKSKIGGVFDLIDQDGKPRTSKDFYGKWVLLYFGFTHCPDICPDEMEKMAEVYDKLKALRTRNKHIDDVVPIMISVDPERDGVSQMKEYCKEFHDELIGLTGSVQKVTETCKGFRVYFSAGPRDDDDDYIVDHTIIIYLLDPEGQFVDYYGQTKTPQQIVSSIQVHMAKYQSELQKSLFETVKSVVSK